MRWGIIALAILAGGCNEEKKLVTREEAQDIASDYATDTSELEGRADELSGRIDDLESKLRPEEAEREALATEVDLLRAEMATVQ